MVKYCVYVHKIKGTDHVFYVGSGDLGRPYHAKRTNGGKRNKKWWEIVDKNGYDIEIIFLTDNRKEAYKYETEMKRYYWSLGMNEACFEQGIKWQLNQSETMKGRKHSKESKEKRSKKAKKLTLVVDNLNSTSQIFNSRDEAKDFIGTTIRTLNNHLDKGTLINKRYEVKNYETT
jgi:hypothetical protein